MAVNKDGYVHKNLTNPQPGSQLAHLSYCCPGLHGPGTKQDVKRRTFKDILSFEGKFIIPIFQRRYCWGSNLVERWYTDSRRGSRDHLGIHNTGNLVVRWSQQDQGYILIDGQQRVTTTLLLLTALRDTIRANIEDDSSRTVLKDISSFLFYNSECEEMKLIPCYLDRESYNSIILGKSNMYEDSFQTGAYRLFSKLLQEDICHKQDKLEVLTEIYHQCLTKMGVTRVEIINEIDMAQVFLWLQEKSLLSGLMIHNPTPGEALGCCDLVRNLLLSPMLNKPIKEQEHFYLDDWILPLERKFSSRDIFNTALKRYALDRRQHVETQSAFEKSLVVGFSKMMEKTPVYVELNAYAMFVTVFESKESNPQVILEDLKVFLFSSDDK